MRCVAGLARNWAGDLDTNLMAIHTMRVEFAFLSIFSFYVFK